VVVHVTELFDPATLADAADDPGRYVERYHFTLLSVVAFVFFAALGVVSVFFVGFIGRGVIFEPPTTPADALVFGGGLAAFVVIAVAVAVFVGRWVYASATHRVAFRADRHGVTLGSQPYPLGRAVTIPWSDIERITVTYGVRPYLWRIGLTLRRGAPMPRGIPRRGTVLGAAYRWRLWWLYNTSCDAGRWIQCWTLDRTRLQAVILTYSPRTEFIPF
jgi:hypothetical protein